MEADFINPFLRSTDNVIRTFATLEIEPGKPSRRHTCRSLHDVTGFISLQSPTARGTLAISFSEQLILHIYEKMLGEPMEKITAEVVDLVGELTNMITGGAKALLEPKGYDFGLAQPVVYEGPQSLDHSLPLKLITVPFTTSNGEMVIEFSMNPVNTSVSEVQGDEDLAEFFDQQY